MAFAFSPGGGTGVGERCHRGVCFLSGGGTWGGGEIGKALGATLRSKTPFPALPSERVAYSPVLLNPAGFEPRIPPVCNSGPVCRQ
jgi:hypothetical protein